MRAPVRGRNILEGFNSVARGDRNPDFSSQARIHLVKDSEALPPSAVIDGDCLVGAVWALAFEASTAILSFAAWHLWQAMR